MDEDWDEPAQPQKKDKKLQFKKPYIPKSSAEAKAAPLRFGGTSAQLGYMSVVSSTFLGTHLYN